MVSKHLLTEQVQKAAVSAHRLDSAERRAAIVDAALPLFAQKGFVATTTKEIAAAAGVSEALIFKHFPSKAALYEAIFTACVEGDAEVQRLIALPPSTAALVEMMCAMTHHFLVELPDDPAELARQRLLVMSHLEDGEFARQVYAWVAGVIQPAFAAAFEAAREAGDVVASPLTGTDALWLPDYLCSMLATQFLPGRPLGAPTYRGPGAARTVAWFLLRGLGLTDDALTRHFPGPDRPGAGSPPDAPAGCPTERGRP
ncbi:TetR/AcrR family transcriptional regulator [Azospirillum sp. ST 5-10]|uniref:TetR/AcrR family transcriptional regulator n=1 Tax=unclassified Azospirillum TaxID=2630922 RepID=UPI003F49CAD5